MVTIHKFQRLDGKLTAGSGREDGAATRVRVPLGPQPADFGAHWGEVNTNVHYGLGCLGVVTNGSVRDIPDSNEHFQMLAGMINPSHCWVHVVDWGGAVSVHGMEVSDGDLIHADRHGAVVVPIDKAEQVVEAARRIATQERILIDAAQQPGFNIEKMKAAWKGMSEIH